MNVPPKALFSNLNEVCATNKTEKSHECLSPSFESASIHSAAIASLMLNWMVEQPLEKKERKSQDFMTLNMQGLLIALWNESAGILILFLA